jgi:hypothetical protein
VGKGAMLVIVTWREGPIAFIPLYGIIFEGQDNVSPGTWKHFKNVRRQNYPGGEERAHWDIDTKTLKAIIFFVKDSKILFPYLLYIVGLYFLRHSIG